ncbi:D(1B) dopamine receptor-like [Sceloporus undulatus]|uniref:D(1B) dopamine receptor-like n=1 Tax=Sceloporus undulatus TaxID=8520 RepID=UPI001C4D1861|nr:D(1B) dopamine receptor-like [Sceloporus undulatus]
MVAFAWGLALLVSFLPVQLGWHQPSPSLNGSLDDEEEAAWHCDASLSRTYAVASSLVSFYIPVAIMGVTYTRIYRIARLQIRRISSLERAALHCRSHHPPPSSSSRIRKETQVLKTLSLLMGVFVCCWLPFFVLNCLLPFCPATQPPCVSRATFDAFVWVGWANSALNPFIYASDAEFRKVFAGFLRGPAWRRRRRRRESDATPAESANASRHPLRRLLGGRGEGELSLDLPPSREMATSSHL